MKITSIFLIVLSYNQENLTLRCIRSIMNVKFSDKITLILVDNASDDRTVEKVMKEFKNVKILKNDRNYGYAKGNNIGIKYALRKGADVVILLNNDTYIKSDFIKPLVKEFSLQQNLGIAGPTIYRIGSGKTLNAGIKINKRFMGVAMISGGFKPREVDVVSGSTIAIRKETFRKVGFLDERFFIYFEEADLCIRTRKYGYKVMNIPESRIYHEEGGTNQFYSPFHTYYNARNHLLFIEKHGTKSILINELLLSLKLSIKKIVTLDENGIYRLVGVLDYIFRRFGFRKYWN